LLEFTPSHTGLPKEALPTLPGKAFASPVTEIELVTVSVDVGIAVVVTVVVVEPVADGAVDVEEPRSLRPACGAWASAAMGLTRKPAISIMEHMTG
jgi:hypothetical protein